MKSKTSESGGGAGGVATDLEPRGLMGSLSAGCCTRAWKDHLQSMQSSTQHPNEEADGRNLDVLTQRGERQNSD